MQSPFPGMDPYLEDPSLWPDVHHELLSVARELLHRQLRPQYHVRVEERVYISDGAQKRGQESIAKWSEGCSALLVPDPFCEAFEDCSVRKRPPHPGPVPQFFSENVAI